MYFGTVLTLCGSFVRAMSTAFTYKLKDISSQKGFSLPPTSILLWILGFHVTSEKTKIKLRLKILSFYLYRVKDIFKRIFAGLSSAR